MAVNFARIYGDGILNFRDLPDSLRSREDDIQAWIDAQPREWGKTYSLRIDTGSETILYLMESKAVTVLEKK